MQNGTTRCCCCSVNERPFESISSHLSPWPPFTVWLVRLSGWLIGLILFHHLKHTLNRSTNRLEACIHLWSRPVGVVLFVGQSHRTTRSLWLLDHLRGVHAIKPIPFDQATPSSFSSKLKVKKTSFLLLSFFFGWSTVPGWECTLHTPRSLPFTAQTVVINQQHLHFNYKSNTLPVEYQPACHPNARRANWQ